MFSAVRALRRGSPRPSRKLRVALVVGNNAACRATRDSKCGKHGQLLGSIDPNRVITSHPYDLRQCLRSTTVAGQTTSYSYDAAGQLTRVARPNARYIGYECDSAHRQTAVLDSRGNRIEYVLDNACNRIAENTKDPGGNLRRALARSTDALGRVQQTTGGGNGHERSS